MTTTRDLIVTDTLISGPTIEPIDLEEMKKQLKFTPTTEDTLIDTYISMARQHFEEQTGRQLMAATWERRMEAYPYANTASPYPVDLIELPHPPLLSVVSVAYAVEGSPDETVLVEGTDYVVEAPSGPYASRGIIRPVSGGSWPSVSLGIGSVRIRYRAGYGTQPGHVPELIKGALYFLVGHFHRFRSETHVSERGSIESLPLGAEAIIRAFKYSALPQLPPMRTAWA